MKKLCFWMVNLLLYKHIIILYNIMLFCAVYLPCCFFLLKYDYVIISVIVHMYIIYICNRKEIATHYVFQDHLAEFVEYNRM